MNTIEEKRTGVDRRQFSYSHYFPERRKGKERREMSPLSLNGVKKESSKK